MSLNEPGNSSSRSLPVGALLSEFDILKASHQFLREEDEVGGEGEDEHDTRSWEDQLARKYYDSLYREFAVCDLKHYKTGHFALRWRTETEVLEGEGEETCGNTRCEHHHRHPGEPVTPLRTVELPFAYKEHGEHKSALVKVVLCDACMRKLMWKHEKEKRRKEKEEKKEKKMERRKGGAEEDDGYTNPGEVNEQDRRLQDAGEKKGDWHISPTHSRDGEHRKRRQNSRSRSPSRTRQQYRKEHDHRRRRHTSTPE